MSAASFAMALPTCAQLIPSFLPKLLNSFRAPQGAEVWLIECSYLHMPNFHRLASHSQTSQPWLGPLDALITAGDDSVLCVMTRSPGNFQRHVKTLQGSFELRRRRTGRLPHWVKRADVHEVLPGLAASPLGCLSVFRLSLLILPSCLVNVFGSTSSSDSSSNSSSSPGVGSSNGRRGLVAESQLL